MFFLILKQVLFFIWRVLRLIHRSLTINVLQDMRINQSYQLFLSAYFLRCKYICTIISMKKHLPRPNNSRYLSIYLSIYVSVWQKNVWVHVYIERYLHSFAYKATVTDPHLRLLPSVSVSLSLSIYIYIYITFCPL